MYCSRNVTMSATATDSIPGSRGATGAAEQRRNVSIMRNFAGGCALATCLAACAAGRNGLAIARSQQPEAVVTPDEATFSFPSQVRPDSSCAREGAPGTHVYFWLVRVHDPQRWYSIDVFARRPDPIAARDTAWAEALEFADPRVARVGGEPAMVLEIVESTATAPVRRDRMVVRVRNPEVIDEVFNHRPRTVVFQACTRAEPHWERTVPVLYRAF